MKTKLFIRTTLFILANLILFYSCNKKEDVKQCSGAVDSSTIEYACESYDLDEGIFVVIQDVPRYGDNETDLEDYLIDKFNLYAD